MKILFFAIFYIAIASASVFVLIVAAYKADKLYPDPELCDIFGYILCGIFWPLCLLPCLAYTVAVWFIKTHWED